MSARWLARAAFVLIFAAAAVLIVFPERHGQGALVTVAIGAAASYLLSSLASTISWIHPGRYLSLFYWSVGNDQISNGVSAADFTVLILAGLGALAAAIIAFRRADLN
jgi:ABC-2 type transport system permease protein